MDQKFFWFFNKNDNVPQNYWYNGGVPIITDILSFTTVYDFFEIISAISGRQRNDFKGYSCTRERGNAASIWTGTISQKSLHASVYMNVSPIVYILHNIISSYQVIVKSCLKCFI